ncbi:MAG: hypothetical protein M3Y60_14740 [Bacteroidota bacterium]|nr:hypothetical protein [Bacteroidota bacterium]
MELRLLIYYPVFFIALALVLVPVLPARLKSGAGFLIIAINIVLTSAVALRAPVDLTLNAGWVFGEILLRVDELAAWFILIINLTCLTGGWYATHYMRAYRSDTNNLSLHWVLMPLFHYSMIMVVSAQHAMAFLVAWEVMSMSSFLLMMFDHSRFTTLKAGMNYLIQMHISVAILMAAFIWVWVREDDPTFSAIGIFMKSGDARWLCLLFFTGFAIKAGFVPLHTWLPHAHPAAPAPISGIMSGVMVTMGIYGIMRVTSYVTTDAVLIAILIFCVSLLTACYGILSAAIHRDYKRVLAFSTIENMGIAGMGIAVGLLGKAAGDTGLTFLGFAAALLHLLNHSLYKPLLFFSSGTVYQLTHKRNMEQLGGLIRKLPFTSFFFLCGALAIAGLPPFNGFVSKFLLFSGMLEGIGAKNTGFNILMITGVGGLALVGGLSVLTFTKTFSVIFLGSPRSKLQPHPQEVLNTGHLPLFLILFLMLVIALSPSLLLPMLRRVVSVFSPALAPDMSSIALVNTLSNVGMASLAFIVIASVVYFVRSKVMSRRPAAAGPTWACGYVAPNSRMQYTGKSFSKSLSKLLAFVTSEEKKYTEIPPETVFPATRSYQSSYAEFFEKNVINKLSNQVLNVMNQFSFIHNGRLQYYILYGLLFVLFLIVASYAEVL